MKKFLLGSIASIAFAGIASSEPKVLYIGDSIAVETSDTVAWWSYNYIGATTTRAMFGGLAICDFTDGFPYPGAPDSTLKTRVKEDKPHIVVLQFVGNGFTSCMQNLGDEKDAYYKKYYSDAMAATQQITQAAAEVGIPRPKIMWVLRGPTLNWDQAERMNNQYREIAALHGDLVSDAGAEVSGAAFPGSDYAKARYEFTNFVPCSQFERDVGYCTDLSNNLARVHRDDDGTHYCLGTMSGFSCSLPSPGILRYGMRIAQDIQAALQH